MNQSVVSFFNSLPPKRCGKCGTDLQEQADCYMNHCFECMELHLVPAAFSPKPGGNSPPNK